MQTTREGGSALAAERWRTTAAGARPGGGGRGRSLGTDLDWNMTAAAKGQGGGADEVRASAWCDASQSVSQAVGQGPFGLRFYGSRQALAAAKRALNITCRLNSENATRMSFRASTTSAAVVLSPLLRCVW